MDLPTTRNDKQQNTVQEPSKEIKKKEVDKSADADGTSVYEKASLYVFLATLFLAPLVFIPSIYESLDLVKTTVIACGILVSVILYGISCFSERTITISKNPLAYCSLALMLSLIISACLSTNFSKSFFGQGFEVGTASFLILMFLVTFFVVRLVRKDKERALSMYAAIFVAFIILAVFQIARFIGGSSFLSLNILTTPTSTIVGKWNDFAIMTGLAGLLSFFTLKFLPLGKWLKYLLIALLVVCGFFLFAINVSFIWWSIALVLLALGIWEFRSNTKQAAPDAGWFKKTFSRISTATLIVLVIAVVCAWQGNVIAAPLTSSLKINQGELILPWQMTLDVGANTIKQDPFFGAGPNRFVNQFLLYKPQGINPTQFWSAEFTSGFGNIPTFFVNQGLVGIVLWILFFVFFVRYGIWALKKATDPLSKFSIATSFFLASFLWLVNIVYIPSHVIVFFTFVFTGLFFASLFDQGLISYTELWAKRTMRAKKGAVIVIAVTLAVSVVWLGIYVKKAVALTYFQSGIEALNVNHSTDDATMKFKKALWWDASDVYYEALSETDVVIINNVAQQMSQATTTDPAVIKQVSDLVVEAVGYSKKAIAIDPTNYYNYLALAHVSQIASSLKIPNSYDTARTAYTQAIAVNPSNPSLYLSLGQLDASQSKFTLAEQDLGGALQLKPNYTDAVFFLSQVQVNNGELPQAIASAQVATQLNPSDPTIFFELGLLQYNNKDYTDAATALQTAVTLNDQYANARYFLGLSDARLGKNADAIAQFIELEKTNPNNQQVAFILSNLQAGKSPFADAQPPISTTPEKDKTLPVSDASGAAAQ